MDEQLPDGWQTLPISHCATIYLGGTPSRSNPLFWNGDIKWATAADIASHLQRYIYDTSERISIEGIKNSPAKILPKDTIVITSRGTVGAMCMLATDMSFNQTCYGLVAKDGIDPSFLYYSLRSILRYIRSFSYGTVFDTITLKTFDHIRIPIPPLPVQRRIAHILGTLDDKIEHNRRVNATLEAIARALFTSWFVDFDPVRAKADGRTPTGMSAELAALFPATFEDSPLGKIPSGWRVGTVGDVSQIVGGSTPSTKEPTYWEDGTIHWATPKDLASLSSPVLLDTERNITKAGLQQISSGLLPKGTVLLSSRAPIGYLAITQIPVAINQGFIAMICDRDLPNYYLALWAQINMEKIISVANGTTFLEVSKKNFRPLLVIIPPPELLNEYVQQIEPIYQKIVCNLEESRTLAALRDALLPRLLSGEVAVGDGGM